MVRFKADDNEYASSGFRLSWTAVELPKVIEDEHGNYVGGWRQQQKQQQQQQQKQLHK